MSKYQYNKDYFAEINSPEVAYWFGFVCADGCITRFYRGDRLKSMGLEITLCAEDRQHLEKFVQALDSNLPIKKRIAKFQDKEYEAYRLTVSCTKMCRDLIDLGCIPRKTYSFRFPKDSLPHEYYRDFLRGYFDGDGGINISEMNGKPHITCGITGTEAIINDLKDVLIAERAIRKEPKIHYDKRSLGCCIELYGNDSNKDFLDYLYKDATIYLDRKYEAYQSYYKDYDYNMSKRGVYWHKENKAYVVTIYINGKRERVGQYTNIEEAIQARKEAEIRKMEILSSPLNQ